MRTTGGHDAGSFVVVNSSVFAVCLRVCTGLLAAMGVWKAGAQEFHPKFKELQSRMRQTDSARWPGEVVLQDISPQLSAFFQGWRRGMGAKEALPFLGPGFKGSPPPSFKTIREESNGYRHASAAFGDSSGAQPLLDAESWKVAWNDYLSAYSRIDRTEYHVAQVWLGENGSQAVISLDLRLTGLARGGEGMGREDQFALTMEITRGSDQGAWQMVRLTWESDEVLEGRAQFADISDTLPVRPRSEEKGVTVAVAYFAQGVSLYDIDRDGDLDLFVPHREGSAQLLTNDGKGRFTDATDAFGDINQDCVRCGYFFDWDNDADADALLLTDQRIFLLENREGRFYDVSVSSGFHEMSTNGLTGAAVADYDMDGFLDFYIVNYGNPNRGPGYGYFDSRNGFFNKLFRNRGNGTFEDRTHPAGLEGDNRRWSYAALWIDHNGDRRPDLYVVNDYGPNQLYENTDGVFVDVAAKAGALDYGNGMAAGYGDLDGDGVLDLYVSNMHSYAGMRITRSPGYLETARETALRFAKGSTFLRGVRGGGFEEVTDSPLVHARWAWGQTLFDSDNDGDLDVYVANGMFTNREEEDL